MADALNGYLYDFNVYTGATGEALGEKVALGFSEGKTPPAVLRQLFHFHQSAGQTSCTGYVRLWHDPDKQEEFPIRDQ